MVGLSPKFDKDCSETIDKGWGNIKKRFPKLTKFIIVLVIIVGIIGAIIIFSGNVANNWNSLGIFIDSSKVNNYELGKITSDPRYNTKSIVSDSELNQLGKVLGESNITDFSNWKYFEKFDQDPNNLQVFCPSFSSLFPEGRIMYSPYIVQSAFKMVLSATPLSTNRGNVIFEFENLFRCIIGNGNYKNIDCQKYPYKKGTKENNFIEENQKQIHAWINRPFGMKPKTNWFLTIEVKPKENSELINVQLMLKFIPFNENSGQYRTEYFEYNIPAGKPASLLSGRVGVGLIDPEKYRPNQSDQVCAELYYLVSEE